MLNENGREITRKFDRYVAECEIDFWTKNDIEDFVRMSGQSVKETMDYVYFHLYDTLREKLLRKLNDESVSEYEFLEKILDWQIFDVDEALETLGISREEYDSHFLS